MIFGEKKPSITFGKKQNPKFTIGKKEPAFIIKKKPNFTIKTAKKVKDIPAFHQGTNIPINTRDDLKDIVEEPCLKACQELYDKNIETLDSGCNGENCSNCAYIIINYDTLDENNKQIADSMVNQNTVKFLPKSDVCIRNYFNQIFIKVPTSPEELVSSVEKKMLNIIQGFVPQRRIIKKMDPAEIIAMHMRSRKR